MSAVVLCAENWHGPWAVEFQSLLIERRWREVSIVSAVVLLAATTLEKQQSSSCFD